MRKISVSPQFSRGFRANFFPRSWSLEKDKPCLGFFPMVGHVSSFHYIMRTFASELLVGCTTQYSFIIKTTPHQKSRVVRPCQQEKLKLRVPVINTASDTCSSQYVVFQRFTCHKWFRYKRNFATLVS